MSNNIVHTNDGDFEKDVLQSDKAALVDFWAEWCGPCKMIGPALEELAAEYGGKVMPAVSQATDYLIVGATYSGEELERAMRFGVRIVREDSFLELVGRK